MVLAVLTLTSCEEDVEKSPADKEGIEAGFVKGRLVNAQGQPIAGATVYAGHTTYYNTNVSGVTDVNGYYKLDVDEPGGSWTSLSRRVAPRNKRSRDVATPSDSASSASAAALAAPSCGLARTFTSTRPPAISMPSARAPGVTLIAPPRDIVPTGGDPVPGIWRKRRAVGAGR